MHSEAFGLDEPSAFSFADRFDHPGIVTCKHLLDLRIPSFSGSDDNEVDVLQVLYLT